MSTIKVQSILSVNGTPAVNIDSEGRVFRNNIPAFWAYGGVNTSATNPLVFTTTGLNTGNVYDTTNGKFTAPVSGLYCISFRVAGNVGTDTQFRLYINDSVVAGLTGLAYAPASEYGSHSVTAPVLMQAGDYAQVYVTQGTALMVANYNSGFSGWLIG